MPGLDGGVLGTMKNKTKHSMSQESEKNRKRNRP